MILQIAFDALNMPDTFTTGFAILLVGFFSLMLYSSFRLRSLIGKVGWALVIISFIFSIITPLPFRWFWLIVSAETFILVLAAIEYNRQAMGANS